MEGLALQRCCVITILIVPQWKADWMRISKNKNKFPALGWEMKFAFKSCQLNDERYLAEWEVAA